MIQEVPRWWPYGLEIPYARRELLDRAQAAGFVDAETDVTGFWHAVGLLSSSTTRINHPSWSARRSRLDRRMGINLVLTARRPAH